MTHLEILVCSIKMPLNGLQVTLLVMVAALVILAKIVWDLDCQVDMLRQRIFDLEFPLAGPPLVGTGEGTKLPEISGRFLVTRRPSVANRADGSLADQEPRTT